jgi:hypothetical protein
MPSNANTVATFQSIFPNSTDVYFVNGEEKSGAQMYVVRMASPGHVVFNFRGTESAADVRTDLAAWKERVQDIDYSPYKKSRGNVKVHAGFLAQFFSLKHSIASELLRASRKVTKVRAVFTGHSLGGALATIASTFAFALLGNDVDVECYTYGSPRVGNQAFVRFFNDHVRVSVRCVHGADIVTRALFLTYRHVKGHKHLGRNASCLFGCVDDHDIGKYEHELSALIPNKPGDDDNVPATKKSTNNSSVDPCEKETSVREEIHDTTDANAAAFVASVASVVVDDDAVDLQEDALEHHSTVST